MPSMALPRTEKTPLSYLEAIDAAAGSAGVKAGGWAGSAAGAEASSAETRRCKSATVWVSCPTTSERSFMVFTIFVKTRKAGLMHGGRCGNRCVLCLLPRRK
jgi:hypothetical protein